MNLKMGSLLLVGFSSISFLIYKDFNIKTQFRDFSLIEKDNDISLYEKWIKIDDSRSARQLKVEFVANASIERVLSVIKDDKITTTWMKGAKACYILKKLDQNNWYSYMEFSVPWPLNNQDCIIKYEILPRVTNDKVEIRLTGLPYYLQRYKNISRIMHMECKWILYNHGEGHTKVEYYSFSNQKPQYPRWVTAPIIQSNLMTSMSAFRDLVNK